MTDRAVLGRHGEQGAALYLQDKGYKIIKQNWHVSGGEIDLLAEGSDGTMVVVEVKTRTSADLAEPADNITARKRQTLYRLARTVADRYPERNVRVDLIEVLPESLNHRLDILN